MYFIAIKQIKCYKSTRYIYHKSNTVVHIGYKNTCFCILMALFMCLYPHFQAFFFLDLHPQSAPPNTKSAPPLTQF